MTSPQRRAPQPADSSVLLSVRGVPSWGAVLVGLVFGVGGMIAGHSDGEYTVGWVFGLIFTAGIALATLAVRRGSLFTAMVQAPILLTLIVFGTFRFLAGVRLWESALEIVASFPTMAIATGTGLLLGLVRIIAQPVKRVSSPALDPADPARY